MHKYITLFFLVSLFLFSCKGDNAPDSVISHDRMLNLLTEIHLVDGSMYSVLQTPDSVSKYGTVRYNALFKKFHTDSAQFTKSLRYYAMKPEELQKMYDKILIILKQKSDSLNITQRKADSIRRVAEKKTKTT